MCTHHFISHPCTYMYGKCALHTHHHIHMCTNTRARALWLISSYHAYQCMYNPITHASLHTCTPTHMHPITHAPHHTCIPTHIHPTTHTPLHTCTPTHMHPITHAPLHTCTPTHRDDAQHKMLALKEKSDKERAQCDTELKVESTVKHTPLHTLPHPLLTITPSHTYSLSSHPPTLTLIGADSCHRS